MNKESPTSTQPDNKRWGRISTEYDAAGKVVRSVDVDTNETLTIYNPAGKIDHSVDKFGNTKTLGSQY